MKLGIKYCGGCNSWYDRTLAAQGLIERVKADLPVETTYDTEEACQVWLVLCGCASACADTSGLKAEKLITVSSLSDLAEAESLIRNSSPET